MPVTPTRIDGVPAQENQSYPQFLMTVKAQIAYIQEIHNVLMNTAQTISEQQ